MSKVLMEVDPERNEVWIRLQSPDAVVLRELIPPGTRVSISGVVSTYEATGGYVIGVEDEDDENDRNRTFRKDRFQLAAGTLELQLSLKDDEWIEVTS